MGRLGAKLAVYYPDIAEVVRGITGRPYSATFGGGSAASNR